MKNFSLSLYAFHLRHTMTELPGEAVAGANLLWENLVKVGENSLLFVGLKDLRSKLICYENNLYAPHQERDIKSEWLSDGGCLDLGSIPTTEGFKISGNLQPFLLNDTYAVDLTLFPESSNQEIGIPQLQHFQPTSLLPSQIQPSLGQTIWIYGEVEPNQDCQTLAEKVAIALLAGTNLNPKPINQGELFHSPLFEYQAIDPSEPDNPTKICQILILINNSQSGISELAEKSYHWLINLLCSYHKILYIDQLARQRYEDARGIYSHLEQKIKNFNILINNNSTTQLTELKNLMAEIPQTNLDYTRCLQDLQIHHTAITTNITNYKICLDKIKEIGNGNIPEFWEDFRQKDCHKWQQQIQTDINYLTPGQELFGQLIDTIRGIVETQQAESDRENQDILRQQQAADKQRNDNLQTAIAILGFGLGAAQIGVSAAPYIIPQQPPKPIQLPFTSTQPHPFVLSVGLSLVFAILGAFVGWGLSYGLQRITAPNNQNQNQ